ncbi:hypothetical protein BDZ89DRAFT_359598 [Hymenopellis radicata]|nr:hypothetical protein BDZ89DRAFT_359598 [Hymenopellis radicata]
MSPALNTADQAILSLTYTPGNSLAEQLPIELISSIASFLVGSESDPDDESHTPYGLHHLVSATHVCHRWREAILNDPRLWTDIDFSTTPHASDILAQVLPRSGNLALKISASFLKADPALTQILDVSTRCDDLTLIFPYEMCEGVICQGRPFPKLRCLFLAPFGFPDIDDDPTYYPKFWESFPALKELTLSCMDAEWMRPLPSARCLETVVIEINGDARELFFDFIDILSSSETLTSVTFQAMSCLVDSKNLSANSKKEVVVNKKIESLCLKRLRRTPLALCVLPCSA